MTVLSDPSDVAPVVAKRSAGGDNEVPRDGLGRPRIIRHCDHCERTGRIPSVKRPGNTIQCPKCKGKGLTLKPYTRTTTFIDCIEDKSNLETWHKRMVLRGVAMDPGLLNRVEEHWEEHENGQTEDDRKVAKDWLNRRAEAAAEKAGSSEKADKGTFLHGLSEMVDQGKELPEDIAFEDVIDMDAYKRATTGFSIVHMERLMVLDPYGVAGTPDRVSSWCGDDVLEAPDGTIIDPEELLITDLKTGRVDYGALKMAMQLSIYSRSKLYNKDSGAREAIERLNQRWGVIMHLPAGEGECTLYWADLTMGWQAVQVAKEIRALRSSGRKALRQFRRVSLAQSV